MHDIKKWLNILYYGKFLLKNPQQHAFQPPIIAD